MNDFRPGSAELRGGFTVPAPVAHAFELFSPLGETLWVPDWRPELLHPPGGAWERGLIFRTREETGDAVWVVTGLDREAHEVEYHRVEAARYVARVAVRCTPVAASESQVQVTYTFVGLSESGNAEIGRMTDADHAKKMERWKAWIAAYLAGVQT